MTFTDATELVEEIRRPDNQLTAWTCDECGSLVVDVAGNPTNRTTHERWHGGVNRSINEASLDFKGS